jgi:fatty acyl-CoA reductase
VFEYYTNKQWHFRNEHADVIRKMMNERERKDFKIDGNDLDIKRYLLDATHAARLYILNERPETLPAARRHIKV